MIINKKKGKKKHLQLEIASKWDIKAENSSTLCKFHEGKKGLRSVGCNATNPERWVR